MSDGEAAAVALAAAAAHSNVAAETSDGAAAEPAAPPPLSGGGAAAAVHRLPRRQRERFVWINGDGWHVSASYDCLYWTLATFVWWTYATKLVPQLCWADNVQHIVMGAGVVGMAALSTLRPEAYRRHGPALRLLLLAYGLCMPVLTSLPVMQAFTPAPSRVPLLGGLVDAYSLWLSTRNAFLAWALLGCRPPLHLALPLQLFGLWRISAAGFCAAPVLQHPLMVERTWVAHMALSLGSYAATVGSPALQALIPATAYQRCSALLLFYNALFGVLLPLLLLVPLRHAHSSGSNGGRRADGSGRRGWPSKLDGCIEACLRPLMWPALLRGMAPRGDGPAAAPTWGALLQRWYFVLVVLWTLCCALHR